MILIYPLKVKLILDYGQPIYDRSSNNSSIRQYSPMRVDIIGQMTIQVNLTEKIHSGGNGNVFFRFFSFRLYIGFTKKFFLTN